MADKKRYIWLAACTGQGGPVLRTGKPFDPADHKWLDLAKAVEEGKAKLIDEDDEPKVIISGTPKTEFEALGLKGVQPLPDVEVGRKGKKS